MNTNIDKEINYCVHTSVGSTPSCHVRDDGQADVSESIWSSIETSVEGIAPGKVWADVEIPVGDVVCIQVNDNISDKLYNYEY